jgi:hypothetical protein
MPQKRIIYLDYEWTKFGEADDIIAYYTASEQTTKYDIQIKTSDELINMPSRQILNGIIFAETSIIQTHIKAEFPPEKAKLIIPNTYERDFTPFFKREINIITLDTLRDKYLANDESRFIKPLGNNKLFDGQVIDDFADLDKLLSNVSELSPTTRVYSSPVIDIQGEIRLLIGAGRLYGRGQISIADPPNQDYLAHGGFLERLIRTSAGRFLCVDIGWVPELGSWIVVEINPPFSLEDYDIPLVDYLEFTEDVFQWIREN